jgi:hypothetical protein
MKWIVDGALVRDGSKSQEPEFISEPFETDEGAKSFARLLTEKGYSVVVRTFDGANESETLSGLDVDHWISSLRH